MARAGLPPETDRRCNPGLATRAPVSRHGPKGTRWSFHRLLAVLLVAQTGLLCSCSMGPHVLKGNRTDYNVSIYSSNNEEMLLNLVRLRHHDAPFFLNVSSVSSSFNFALSAGFDIKANAGPIEGYKGQYPYNSATPSVGTQFSETPTISYVPLSGERFATQLLTEISLDRLLFLSRAGWDIELLFQVLVKRFGNCVNSAIAMDTQLNLDPVRTGAFDKLVALLRRLQARGDMEFQANPEGMSGTAVALLVRFRDQEEIREMESLLSLRLPVKQVKDNATVARLMLTQTDDLLAENACDAATCRIFVRLRNFIGVLDSLAQGVALPTGDVASDALGPEAKAPGALHVSCGDAPGPAAFASVRYDRHWYWIAKDDTASRKVFSFLIQLFALEGGELPKNTPVLTLPVVR